MIPKQENSAHGYSDAKLYTLSNLRKKNKTGKMEFE